MIVYSIGRNRFDAFPMQRQANTLRDLASDILAPQRRARDKASAGYLCTGFGGDGRRSAANALPDTLLRIDFDGIDPDAHPDLRMHLTRWRGFGWPTASSLPEAPRERVVIELSEAVARQQGMAIGELLAQDIEAEFGAAVRIDRCTFRPEQPCFLPLHAAQPFYLLGDPLDVPTWLQQVPPPPPAPPPPTAEAAAIADARMRHVVGLLGQAGMLTMPLPNSRGYGMRCPWEAQHTTADAPGTSATALLFPAEPNGWMGAFKCLHSHCQHRRLSDLLQLLRAVEREAA